MSANPRRSVRADDLPAPRQRATISWIKRLLDRSPWPGVIVFSSALAIYLPTVTYQDLNFDDPAYLFNNPAVLRPDGLLTIWTTPQMPEGATNWPLVFTTFWCEYRVWLGWPGGFHLVNAILHAWTSVWVFRFLREMGAGRWVAWWTAMMFALHPAQVESVAWITERKNVLSGVFFFASLTHYARWRRNGLTRSYAAFLALYVAALLSKSTVVVAPVLILWMDALGLLPNRSRQAFLGLLPAIALSLAACLVTAWADKPPSRALPIAHRPLVASTATWFYVKTLLFPFDTQPMYPRWRVLPNEFRWHVPWMALVALSAFLAWHRRRIDRFALFGLGWFVLCLAPVIGLVPFEYLTLTYVADHFVYLPSVGLFLAVSRLFAKGDSFWPAREESWATLKRSTRVAGLAALVGLAALTESRLETWRDRETFWARVLERSPAVAHDGLANQAYAIHDLATAARHLRVVHQYRPWDAYVTTSLGQLLFRTGSREQGMALLQEAVSLDPGDSETWKNLGNALLSMGQPREAVNCFLEVRERNPKSVECHLLLGACYYELKEFGSAEASFAEAVRIDPKHREARVALDRAQRRRRAVDERREDDRAPQRASESAPNEK